MTKKEQKNEMMIPLTNASDIEQLAPELFTAEASTVVDELAGVWAKEAAPRLLGVITHAYSWMADQDDGSRTRVRGVAMQLKGPTMVSIDRGAPEPVPAGEVVGVTLGYKLDVLRYLRPGDTVYIQYLGEVSLPGSARRVHKYKVQSSALPRETPMRDGSPVEEAF